MELNNKSVLLIFLIFLTSGCGFLGWTNSDSLEEYGDKVRVSIASLVPYIGKSKEDVIEGFGKPTEIIYDSSMIATHYQVEKVPFDELWYYSYRRGIPGVNAEGSTRRFFFYNDMVVSVDAF